MTDGGYAVTGIFVQGIDVTQHSREQKRREALFRLTDLVRTVKDPVELGYGTAEFVGVTVGAIRAGLSRIDLEVETLIAERNWTREGVNTLPGRPPCAATDPP